MLQIVDPAPHGAAMNMAIDEVLLSGMAGAQMPVLRIYSWARPAVSFGYFTKFSEMEPVFSGREPVRRWTGGGTVFHRSDLTYTLVVPRGHEVAGLAAPESYRQIHRCIMAALAGVEQPAVMAAPATAAGSRACFESPVEHDVLSGTGQKLAGAAQRRTRHGLLHQGSIQMEGAAGLLGALAGRLPREFAEGIEVRSLSHAELARAQEIAAQKYASAAWLRRF